MSEFPPPVPPPQIVVYPRAFVSYRRVPRGPKRFDLDVIGQAWQLVQQNLGTWILAMLCLVAVTLPIDLVENLIALAVGVAPRHGAFPSLGEFAIRVVIAIPGGIVRGALNVGLIGLGLRLIRGQPFTVADVFSFQGRFPALLLLSAIISAISLITFAFLILPALMMGTLFAFAGPLVLDKGMSPQEALRTSWDTVRPHLWSALWTLFVVGLAAVSGVFLCCVGVLFTAAIGPMALALLYDRFFDEEPDLHQTVVPPSTPGQTGSFPA